jgi:hypothetical protein
MSKYTPIFALVSIVIAVVFVLIVLFWPKPQRTFVPEYEPQLSTPTATH